MYLRETNWLTYLRETDWCTCVRLTDWRTCVRLTDVPAWDWLTDVPAWDWLIDVPAWDLLPVSLRSALYWSHVISPALLWWCHHSRYKTVKHQFTPCSQPSSLHCDLVSIKYSKSGYAPAQNLLQSVYGILNFMSYTLTKLPSWVCKWRVPSKWYNNKYDVDNT